MSVLRWFSHTDWGPAIAVLLGGSGGAYLWWRKKREEWAAKRERKRRLREAQLDLPETLEKLTTGFGELEGTLVDVGANIEANTEAIGKLTALTTGAMEASSTPQAWFDHRARIISCNEAMTRLVGTGKRELLEYGYHELMNSDHIKQFMTEFEWMVRHRRGKSGQSYFVNRQGRKVYVTFKITPAFQSPDETEKRARLFICVMREDAPPPPDSGFSHPDWGALQEGQAP